MVGNRDTEASRNLERTINKMIEDETELFKRVERLETLEFEKAAKSNGCISWLDYDSGAKAAHRVDVPANPFELGDYGWTHLTVFWALNFQGGTTLRMRINGLAGANYGYNYSYSVGSGIVETAVGAEGQTSMVVGRSSAGGYYTVGWFHIPFFPIPEWAHTYGDWVTYNPQAEIGSVVERGKFGGIYFPGAQRVIRIDLFASAGNVDGYTYLYAWCPTWDIATGPPD